MGVLAFLADLHGDAGLKARFDAEPTPANLLALARERGYDLDPVALRDGLERYRSETIDDELLDAVVGGTGGTAAGDAGGGGRGAAPRGLPDPGDLRNLAEEVWEYVEQRLGEILEEGSYD